MRQEVQWYLAEGLAHLRALPGPDSTERRQGALAGFSAKLDALRYVDEISDDEQTDWHHRLLIALGIEPPPPAELGMGQLIFVGPGPRPSPPPTPPTPAFVRSWLGPDQEWEYHGGRFRIIAVDLFDTMFCIRWRLAPEPDLNAVFPSEAAQFARDIEGIDDWAKGELRKKAERQLRFRRLSEFSLTDDLGTEYFHSGGGSSGRQSGMSGDAEFSPVPPPGATRLELTWLELTMEIPLPDRSTAH